MKPKKQSVGVENEAGKQAPGVIEMRDLLAISPAEASIKARAENVKIASKHRIPDQAVLEDKAAAQGIMLQPEEVIRRLQLLNPKILVLKGGVRYAVQLRYPTDDPFAESATEYITGFYIDEGLPEFSSVTVDENGLPKRELRGWRSVLSALIRRGILDIKKVDALFGPATGQRTGLWYRNLQALGKNI